MKNQIQTIWHNPEYKSWKNIYYYLTSRKVYVAAVARRAAADSAAGAAEPARRAAVVAENKPKVVLEYIFNWNMTWWQNN